MNINEKLKVLWHGCDYNPDQWLEYPEVLEKDIELMKKSGCNVMSVGIFAWSSLEPEEGVFNFEWLDSIIDNLYNNGIYTLLATPSGAMPVWMAEKYPEAMRVSEDGIRRRFGDRHNHCYSSPVYREKVKIINTKLAERYSKHPGIVMWHISNEYNTGDCHCELCKENFRKYLKDKYGSIEELNRKWWNGFWSHRYQKFSQIDPPGWHGEASSNPLKLEWRRFKSLMVCDFVKWEADALKAVNPDVPVTTNFMRFFEMDYPKIAEHLDFISWDNYPDWHSSDNDSYPAADTAMFHDMFRSMKPEKPFLLMESSPSATNWQSVSKLRRPGMHKLASIQAVAHGSDTVQYFQWRKSRGQSEQFHGAVVGHDNSDDTRVFRDVTSVGDYLKCVSELSGSVAKNKTAILFDYDSVWSLTIAQCYRNCESDKGFRDILFKNYKALWNLNIGCDFVYENSDFSGYDVIVAPMLFMLKKDIKAKIEKFVENGGVFVTTFGSGVVDDDALSYFDDECYPLRKLTGVKAEETDSLYNGQFNTADLFGKEFKCERYCELAYEEGAEVLSRYKSDFYKDMPVLTVNNYGKGKVYYIASDFSVDGYEQIYKNILGEMPKDTDIVEAPENVSVTVRYSEDSKYIFVMNFNNNSVSISVKAPYTVIGGELSDGIMEPYGITVLKV